MRAAKKRGRSPYLHADSVALRLLWSLSLGSAKIVGTFAAAVAPIPRTRAMRRWRYTMLHPEEWEEFKDRKDFERKIYQAMVRLQQKRFITVRQKKGTMSVIVTEQGNRYAKQFSLDSLVLAVPKKWDGKWRIVMFDIPEKYKNGREALRDKLRALHFFPLQKSVFAYPYPCRAEVEGVVHAFGMEEYVVVLEASDLGRQENMVRTHFRV